MNFKKLLLFCFFLVLAGCSSEITVFSVPDSGLQLKLIKGNPDFNDPAVNQTVNQNTYVVPYQDSIAKKKYPNPFCPSMLLGIQLPNKDSVIIDLLNINKNLIGTIFIGELDEGRYSLVVLKGNYVSGAYIIRVRRESKEWLYSMWVVK